MRSEAVLELLAGDEGRLEAPDVVVVLEDGCFWTLFYLLLQVAHDLLGD